MQMVTEWPIVTTELIAKTRQFIQDCKALGFQKTAVKQQKSKASFTGRLENRKNQIV